MYTISHIKEENEMSLSQLQMTANEGLYVMCSHEKSFQPSPCLWMTGKNITITR